MNTAAPDSTAPLTALRDTIDAVDADLLRLLNQRAALSLAVGRIKALEDGVIFRPQREREVLDNLLAQNRQSDGPLKPEHIRAVWREIFSASRALQRPQKVAYLGPEGTFSHFAALEYLGSAVECVPRRNLHEVFCAVYQRECELGVVPLENSLQGTVGQSADLFYRFPVAIYAELYAHISHALLATVDSLAEVRRVYSHPQPFAQCAAWLRAHLPEASLIPVESTAAAAHRAAAEPGSAAIGHVRLADMLPLRVLAKGIADAPDNWTRFVVIGPAPTDDAPRQTTGADKTSLLFTLPDKPGALAAVLQAFAREGVNMRKLESRTLPQDGGQTWQYVFFADVECDLLDADNPTLAALRAELGSLCVNFRILGAYPAGTQHGLAEPDATTTGAALAGDAS